MEDLIPANHIKIKEFFAMYYSWTLQEMHRGRFYSNWDNIHCYLIDSKTVKKVPRDE